VCAYIFYINTRVSIAYLTLPYPNRNPNPTPAPAPNPTLPRSLPMFINVFAAEAQWAKAAIQNDYVGELVQSCLHRLP
jgi:hypothetical protein